MVTRSVKFSIEIPERVYFFLFNLRNWIFPALNVWEKVNLRGDRDVEWSWIVANMPTGPGRCLDFGGGGGILGLIAAQKGFESISLDLVEQNLPYIHPKLSAIEGDILKVSFEDSSFDLVVNCSSVEHVGLAGRYGVAHGDSDGDLVAMERLRRLLKPSGTMLLTVPVGQDVAFAPVCRVYGVKRLPMLLKGYTVTRHDYWVKNDHNQWVSCDKATALSFEASASSGNPMKDVYALGCFVLQHA
jgi:SAM-dependent methyltransferase